MNIAIKFAMNTTDIKHIFIDFILINFPTGVMNTMSSIKNINSNPQFIALLENSPCLVMDCFKFLQDIE